MLKKLIPIIPIGLSIFVVVLVLICAVFVKPEPVVPVQPVIVNNDVTPTPPIPAPPVIDDDLPDVDTSDWKTYTNEEFGFELKYPEHWVIGSPAYIGNASRSGNTYHILGMTPYGFEGDWSVLISVTPHPIDEILEDDNYYWNKGWDIENKGLIVNTGA